MDQVRRDQPEPAGALQQPHCRDHVLATTAAGGGDGGVSAMALGNGLLHPGSGTVQFRLTMR